MTSQYIFENISIYNEVEVDCFQNLLISYLELYNADTNFLKICWPWKFESSFIEKNNKYYMTLNQYESISLKRISDIYHNEGIQVYFNNENRILALIEHIKRYQAVFVCVDEYYIPYHYNHIFEKQHGLHTLLVTNIDLQKKIVQCVSSIPFFRGSVPLDLFEKAIYSPEIKEWFVYFKSHKFANHLNSTYKEIIQKEFALVKLSDKIIYTKDFLNYLRGIDFNDCDIDFLCKGTWGWKITAKGNLMIDVIKEIRPFNKNHFEIIDSIEQINLNWSKGYKLLFKTACSMNKKNLYRAIKYIESAYKMESALRKMVYESMEEKEKNVL